MSSPPTGLAQRRWIPSRSQGFLIFGSLAVGVGILALSAVLGDWWQSLLINLGTAVLLVAPLTYVADFLQRRLEELSTSLQSSVAGLSAIRNLLPHGEARTAIFDQVLDAVKARAADGEFPASQIATLLGGDSDDRTVALAAMISAPSLVNGSAVLRSVRRPGSGNEQYYALCAAEAAWTDELTDDQRGRILAAVDEDDRTRRWITEDPHRAEIADRLRHEAPPPADPG